MRIVAFHDTLMRGRVDLPALGRASAGLAECVAGIRLHGMGRAARVSPHGTAASTPPSPASTTAPIALDEERLGTVWLERPGGRRTDRPARTTRAAPALVELAISSASDEAARTRALRLLGFAAELPVHVVAVRSQLPLGPDRRPGLPGPSGESRTARRRGRHPGHHQGPGLVSDNCHA
jgi:hypothetical protein